jgi:glycerol kinase
MSSRCILAVDQSTSATKACLFDETGALLGRATAEHRQIYPQPGWVEHDPIEIIERTHQVIESVVAEHNIDEERIVALSITNQRETIVAWDERSGMPLYNALVWQDERGAPICDRLAADPGIVAEIKERTGLVIDSYFSASKLRWLCENAPESRVALASGKFMAGTIDAWLVWNLSGKTDFATDYSNASRTLLFNINTRRWDERLLHLFDLPGTIRLPEVRYSDESFGTYTFRSSGRRIPIVGVMGDSHAALYGHTAFSVGSTKATFGTGSSVMMNIGETPRVPPEGIVTSVGWGNGGSVSYVFEGNIHHTGDTLRWVRDQLGLFRDYGEAENRAVSVQDNGGVYLVPAFAGLGAPYWIHGVRAAITGMSRTATADHIIRAALESMAYQVSDVVNAMTRDAGVTLPAIMADGGASRNAFVMQFLADILGAPVEVGAIEEVSARGVAFVAGLQSGFWTDEDHLKNEVLPARVFTPQMGERHRDSLLAGWHTAIGQVFAGKSHETGIEER